MSKQDVATLLSVSTKTVERLVRRGEFPVYKIGKAVRIKREDIDRYLNRQKQVFTK